MIANRALFIAPTIPAVHLPDIAKTRVAYRGRHVHWGTIPS